MDRVDEANSKLKCQSKIFVIFEKKLHKKSDTEKKVFFSCWNVSR